MSASDSRTFRLISPEVRGRAHAAIGAAPDGYTVKIGPPTRTLDQNALLHSLLGDIAKTGFELNGRKLDAADLKTAFVSGWMIENGMLSDIIAGFAGEAVQLRRSTTTFSKAELSSLVEYIYAECALRGVTLPPRKDEAGR